MHATFPINLINSLIPIGFSYGSVRCSVADGNGSSVKRTTLHDLYEKEGQSPWYDNLCRPVTDLLPLIASGVRGVTSNPAVNTPTMNLFLSVVLLCDICLFWSPITNLIVLLQIFQKAISSSNAYNDQFRYSY